MSVKSYDPDDDDVNYSRKKKPASWQGKTKLQKALLEACGRTSNYFSSKQEKQAFVKHEEYALGERTDSYLYRKWIEYNIEKAKIFNKKIVTRTVSNVIRAIDNEEIRIDWIARNRKRLLKERKTFSITDDILFTRD